MLVRSRMTRDVVTATPATTLFEALALMHERRIRHLPVLADDRLVGIVTDRDLRTLVPAPGTIPEAESRRLLEERHLAEVMVRDVVTVLQDTPVEEAAKLMHRHRIGALPVVSGERLVGILTASDLLRAFVELFGVHRPSSRLEVRMPNRAGELARAVHIVGEELHLNITGLVVPPVDGDEALAVIRIETLDPRAVVAALRDAGFRVGWPTLDHDEG
jgi:acetoin utilization protein AcuB